MNRNTMRRIGFTLIAAGIAGAAWAYGDHCPIDGNAGYFTGTTQVDSATGKLMWLYKCPMGHEYWVIKS